MRNKGFDVLIHASVCVDRLTAHTALELAGGASVGTAVEAIEQRPPYWRVRVMSAASVCPERQVGS